MWSLQLLSLILGVLLAAGLFTIHFGMFHYNNSRLPPFFFPSVRRLTRTHGIAGRRFYCLLEIHRCDDVVVPPRRK